MVSKPRSVQSSRWDGAIFLIIPGTSCLATMGLSLRDKRHSSAEALLGRKNPMHSFSSRHSCQCQLGMASKDLPQCRLKLKSAQTELRPTGSSALRGAWCLQEGSFFIAPWSHRLTTQRMVPEGSQYLPARLLARQ